MALRVTLTGKYTREKIAIKEARRCFGGSVREEERSKIVGRQLRSDLFNKNSLSNDSADNTQLE